MRNSKLTQAIAICALLVCTCAGAGSVTGNPLGDGWVFSGNSLQYGVYDRGDANYGFDVYTYAMRIASDSNLVIGDGENSWEAGDTVLGLGGSFHAVSATDNGWSAYTGGAVNGLLSVAAGKLKLQAKFGATSSTFAPSTIAPGAGDGKGSLGTNGGSGAVQVRTTAWYTPAQWYDNAGDLMLLDKASHIERNGIAAPDADVARLMWTWTGDEATGYVSSWEILLNVSLLDQLQPSLAGTIPLSGESLVLATVQNGDGKNTDALVTLPETTPEPISMVMLGCLGGGMALARKLRGKSA